MRVLTGIRSTISLITDVGVLDPTDQAEFGDFDGGYKGSWMCTHDEDGDWVFAYCGPFEFTAYSQRERMAP